MTKKKDAPGSDDFRIFDPGIERLPRLPAVPPSVAGTSTAAGAWGGGGDDGSDYRAGVGTSVGIGVGTSVGIGVGTSVGIGVGTSVGIGVGTSVGIGVGTSVGIGTGTSVGVSANLAGGGLSETGFAIDASGAGASLRLGLLLARQQELLSSQLTKDEKIEDGRLTARDLWKTVRIAQPALSPDGAWVAFVKLERPSGGELEHERIYVKRVGSAPGKEEYPLTDNTVLADTPVWKPNLFYADEKISKPGPEDRPERAEILFRARATVVDVLQLYVVELELPSKPEEGLRIGRVRRLTNAPTHPWAPKWRRFKDSHGVEQNRIYYVATSPESPPSGYDHLIYDDALVGWWNNLRLPHDRWRFYELDADAPGAPRDLLGAHQPLLDFVNGVWNCWDVHPAGAEMVWVAANRDAEAPRPAGTPRWPNDVTMDIFRLRLRGAAGGAQAPLSADDPATVTPERVTGLTDNIIDRVPQPDEKGQYGYIPSKLKEERRRGRFDDYMPMYSPDGEYIVYAEKQFSTLPADYPRIVRLNLPGTGQAQIVNGVDVFNLIKPPSASTGGPDRDVILPLGWRFSGPNDLLVLVEENGQHALRTLTELREMASDPAARKQICDKGCVPYHERRDGSVHDFDVLLSGKDDTPPRFTAVTSSIKSPPELRFSPAETDATTFNDRIAMKSKRIEVWKRAAERASVPARLCYGHDRDNVEYWLAWPPKLKQDIEAKTYKGETYPLVQLLHGGPNSSWVDEFHMRFNASLLASQGYVVALVNFRGSTGTSAGEPPTAESEGEAAEKKESVSEFLKLLKMARASEDKKVVETPLENLGETPIDPAKAKENWGVNTIVKTALENLGQQPQDPEEARKIQDDLGGKNESRFRIRHLRKIECHADRALYRQFVDALSEEQYKRLIQRPNQTDLSGWGSAMTDVELVTAALRKENYIDKDRLAVIGGSYGAYLGARLLGSRERLHDYKAYVLHAGVYEPISHFASDAFWVQYDNFGDRPWVRERADEAIGTTFDDGDPGHWRRFSRISPLLRSQRLVQDVKEGKASAVLITHGLGDLRVHWQQSVLLHRMLKDRGVKSRLALYPGLGHRLDQPEPSVQWWSAALAWLNDHGVEPGGK